MADPQVFGEYEARFAGVCQLLAENLRSGAELGASICVDVGGRTALNVWGGYRDEQRRNPWERDTIVNLWSITGAITGLAALMLVEHGELQLDLAVHRYWPEFAHNGKEEVLVRHVLSHTAGLPGWSEPITLEQTFDRERSCALLAAQEPWWVPGTRCGYHVLTRGHILAELVRRITGMAIEDFVREQISEPLGADFQIGAPEHDWGRISALAVASGFDRAPFPEDSMAHRTFDSPRVSVADVSTPGWRHAALPALGGHGNAHSVARILSALTLGGERDGVSLLSQRTVDRILSVQAEGTDAVMGVPIRMGIGYALPYAERAPYVPEGRVFFWTGRGGSSVVMDLDRGVTTSYVTNTMQPGVFGSAFTRAYIREVYAGLGVALPEVEERVFTHPTIAAATSH